MPPKTEADLRAWEAKKGFRGVIVGGKIYRKCVECDQPTRSLAETHCPKDGGKRQVVNECQVEGCTNRAIRPRARCARLLGRGGPGGARLPRVPEVAQVHSRADGLCGQLRERAAVAAKRVRKARGASATVRRRGHRGRPRRRQGRRLPHALRRAQPEGRPQAVHDGAGRRRVDARVRRARVRPRGGVCPRHAQHALRRARRRQVRARAGLVQLHGVQPEHCTSAPIAARGALAS